MTVKALIFDFDGLILDTEFPIYNAIRTIFQRYGQDLPLDEYTYCIGGDEKDDAFLLKLQSRIHEQLDIPALQAEIRDHMMREIYQNPILPGVKETLQKAEALQLPCIVASSSEQEWVVNHVERLGLTHFFTAICTADDVKQVKPEPDLFLLALKKANVQASEAIVFEDSSNGIIAAYRAGIFSVAVPSKMTEGTDFSKANLIVKRIDEIPLEELLTKII